MRVLAGGGQLVVARPGVELPDGGARLHRIGHQPVIDQFQPGDMGGRFHRGIDRVAVVLDPAPVKAQIVGDLVMHAVTGIGDGCGHIDDRGQFFDLGACGHRFGGIARLLIGFGHDSGISIAHMAHLAVGQHGALGFAHGRAVARMDQPACRIATHIGKIRPGKNRQHTGHGVRGGCVNRHNTPMRHVCAHHHRVNLTLHGQIVGIGPAPGQKADILAALRSCADTSIFGHCRPPLDMSPRPITRWACGVGAASAPSNVRNPGLRGPPPRGQRSNHSAAMAETS